MKKTMIALSLIPALTFAVTAEQKEAMLQANIKVLEKQGLPIPGSGVQVVPSSQIKMPEWQRKKFLMDYQEQKSKGYVNKASMRAHELIHIEAQIKKQGLKNTAALKATDTELRTRPEDIAFAYSYIGVPESEIKEFFGIAPVGAYVNEPQTGWTGGVAFFKTSFANCAYTEKSFRAGQGAVQIDQDAAQYDVNGKVTLIDIEGNQSRGFLYRVNWFDHNYNRDLECASKEYSEEISQSTIALAKKIDKA